MKKILMITTGGTIGSSIDRGVISARKGSCLALSLYLERYGGAEIEAVSAMDILSEELTTGHWERLLTFIGGLDLNGYDGLIITHGSDTLSYTSAFLGLCLCGLEIPVVITAADRVPDDPESNAAENIRAAVLVIEGFRRGVFTVYKNPKDTFCSVYLATRVCEADRVSGSFSSFDGAPFAKISDGRLVEEDFSLSREEIETHTCPVSLPKAPLINGSILMVHPYPSEDHSSIVLKKNTKAVLYITYHSSSASTQGKSSALTLLKRCRKKDIPFFLCSFGSTSLIYKSSDTLIKNGALPLRHISKEAAYAKLILSLITGESDTFSFMNKEIFCEFI